MQENEFEKQVQQKMDALKMQPSEAVWQKIKPRITKEKKRRWILIILPVVLISLLYGGYVILNTTYPRYKNQRNLEKNLIEPKNINGKLKPNVDSIKNTQPVFESKQSPNNYTNANNITQTTLLRREKLNMSTVYKVADSNSINEAPNKQTIVKKQITVQYENLNTNIQHPRPNKTIIIDAKPKIDSATIFKSDSLNNTTVDLFKEKKKNDSSNIDYNKKQKTIKNKYPWIWGVSFSLGTSFPVDITPGNGQKSFGISGGASGFPGTATFFTPSIIKSSAAIIAGITTEKNITRKTIFTTGLNYKLLGTTNTTGSDSAAYYRSNADVNTYHNFFYYIEIPFGFKFQIVNSKKTKLLLNTGLSISQLISSNALQFNNITGLYYHDNSLLNKTQFGFNTGLDISLFSKHNKVFFIGPYLNYSISKIASDGYYKHHFTFIGLHTQFILGKK